MAELTALPFLEVIFDQLSSLINKEYHLLRGFSKDLEKLSKIMSTIKYILADVDVKQTQDRRIRECLSELKDVTYDAEDLLDECEFEALKQEPEVTDNIIKQVSASFSAALNFKPTVWRHKMRKRIREVLERFYEINAERLKFHLNPGVPMIVDEGLGGGRRSSCFLTAPIMYGRDEERRTIIQILLDNSMSFNDLSICPIVGMGGLGKTTLAQLVYNDTVVVSHFDCRIWVCVSEDFNIKHISKQIIENLTGKKCDLEDFTPMCNLLQKLLNGRRYLLVLDDVWEDHRGNWEHIIMCLLACKAKGSSIIVTTRSLTVVDAITHLSASCVINQTCDLKCLSDHDSWSLFQHYALGVRDKENEDLIIMGKEIVKKCKGVPLAIKAIGCLLNSRRGEFWRIVRDNEIWHLEEHGEDSILPALRLSYDHLPSVYRQCFAYCSVYPKDYPMKKQMLIHGWMANGFIRSGEGVEAEDVGDVILYGLLQRSFFQAIHVDESTQVVEYKMHDLIHDLACSVTKDECRRIKSSEMEDLSQKVRHVSVTCNSPYPLNNPNSLPKFQPYIRTLMFFVYQGANLSGLDLSLSHPTGLRQLRVLDLGGLWNLNIIPPWIVHLRLLKWLNLENTGIVVLPEFICGLTNLQVLLLGRNRRLTELPSSVRKLKNLRYLDLSETSIKVLPESICILTNLQTLKLEGCLKLEMLPSNLKNLKTLRNLIINWEVNMELLLSGMPIGIGELNRLETLGVFVVGNASQGKDVGDVHRGSSEDCGVYAEGQAGIQELGGLYRLEGSLTIKDIRYVRDPRDAQQANFKNKQKLSKLGLYWGLSEDGVVGAEKQEEKIRYQVLESLQPHSNIQVLQLWDYPGVELPDWLGNCALTLPNLWHLELYNMPNAVHSLHQLPLIIKGLWIVGCPKLRFHPQLRFPSSIERLAVSASNDPTLSSVEALPHLSELQIDGYHQQDTLLGTRLQTLTCLQKLWINNCSNVESLLSGFENTAETLTYLRIS